MNITPRIVVGAVLAAVAVGSGFSSRASAYVACQGSPCLAYTWASSPVGYYLNPTNLDLPDAAVATAVFAGADTWRAQSHASFRFAYAGPSMQTTNTLDHINLVMFRNASSGSAIATTYSWFSGGRIVDADIVFWDGGFLFFTGSTGCSGGFYVEDIAAHEFGHALGLGHSTVPGATMYPSVSSCNTSPRILDPDDIAGVEALYPPALVPPSAPTGVHVVFGSN
jgi:hypothetical protein